MLPVKKKLIHKMKIQLYINKGSAEPAAALFEYEGVQHCTSDIRIGFDEVSIHFSNTTRLDDKHTSLLKRAMDGNVKFEIKDLKEVDLPDDQIEIDYQPHMISGIYFGKKFIPEPEANS